MTDFFVHVNPRGLPEIGPTVPPTHGLNLKGLPPFWTVFPRTVDVLFADLSSETLYLEVLQKLDPEAIKGNGNYVGRFAVTKVCKPHGHKVIDKFVADIRGEKLGDIVRNSITYREDQRWRHGPVEFVALGGLVYASELGEPIYEGRVELLEEAEGLAMKVDERLKTAGLQPIEPVEGLSGEPDFEPPKEIPHTTGTTSTGLKPFDNESE